MKRCAVSVIAACVMLAARPAAGQAPAQVAGPKVSASVDRTAVWVADRVTYTVELRCDPGVDILLDDVAKEKLRLNGLDVVSSEATAATDASDRTTHRLRYVLTTYRADTPSLSIEPLSVRYYARRPGQRLQDVAPAGEVQVPGALIAFRSTLPENHPGLELRDGRAPGARRPFFARAGQIGIALIVISLVPAAVLAAGALRRRTAGRPARKSARQSRHEQREALERLRTLDVSTEDERRRAYDEISTAVRAHLASHAHVPASALTAQEIDAALASGGGKVSRESVVSLLSSADEARYGPPQGIPSAQACRDALATAEQVLTGR